MSHAPPQPPRRPRALRFAGREISLAGLTAMLVTGLAFTGVLAPLERPVGDLLLRVPRSRPGSESPFAAVLIDDASLREVGPLPWPRSLLAALIDNARQAGARGVVLDIILAEPSVEAEDQALEQALEQIPSVLAAALIRDGRWVGPLDRFGGMASAAHAHAEVASDGVIRTISSTKQGSDIALPALSIAATRLAGHDARFPPGTLLRPDLLQPPESIPQMSAVRLLRGQDSRRVVAGRVVFVGIAVAGAADQMFVPVGDRRRPYPGVLIHAAAAASLTRGGLLALPSILWTLIATIGVAVTMQALRSHAGRLHPAHPLVLAAATLLTALLALWLQQLLVPVFTIMLALVVSALAREALESFEARRQAGQLLETLIRDHTAPVRDPMPPGVQGRLELLRRLQAHLVRDRDLRQTLLDGLDEGVVLWDARGTPQLANRAARALWGSPPARWQLAALLGSTARALPVSAELEHNGRRLELLCQPIVGGTLLLARDVTARHQLEQRRRDMQRLVSHELKTPLASLAGFGSMLERYSLETAELHRVAGLIRSEAERLGHMVATFLDLERLGSGHFEGERAAVDLIALVRQRCEVLAAATTERQQQLETRLDEPATVAGVQHLLALLVDNLVGNAIKHAGEGACITVHVDGRNAGATLRVQDTGPGIPEQALPRLFERFYRVPGAPTAGSGLGLALVKEVADWHGACVSIDTQPGAGTVFSVEFPPGGDGGKTADGSNDPGCG